MLAILFALAFVCFLHEGVPIYCLTFVTNLFKTQQLSAVIRRSPCSIRVDCALEHDC